MEDIYRQIGSCRTGIHDCVSRIASSIDTNTRVKSLMTLVDLCEAFSVLSMETGSKNLSDESKLYERLVEKLSIGEKAVCKLNEGFVNPFDDLDSETIAAVEHSLDDEDDEDDFKIRKIRLRKRELTGKIAFSKGKMISGKYFIPNDVIENAPVAIIANSDLYSKTIREFAFELDKDRRSYGIAFGYASFYRNSKDSGLEPNAEYEYNSGEDGYPTIIIRAIKKIRPGQEIILSSDETDFVNELKPDSFRYPKGEDPFYSVKNFKIV